MTVYLVGAGPGDPDLLTLRAARLLEQADVVIHDRLVDQRVLDRVPPTAIVVNVGKSIGKSAAEQKVINELLIDYSKTFPTVIRLKGGDPYVFGRGAEEARALESAHCAYEVVSGVPSIAAVPAAAGVPLTMRGVSSGFIVVTGHDASEEEQNRTPVIDWEHVAKSGFTIVLLMGAENRGVIAERLIGYGKDPATPVLIVEEGTTPRQRSKRTTLAELANVAVVAPAIIVIGDVARQAFTSYEDRVLANWKIVVTRDINQSNELATLIETLGGEVIKLPTIAIADTADRGAQLRDAMQQIDQHDWIVFSSVNAVDRAFRFLHDARAVGHAKVATIGTATAAALERLGVKADFIPSRYVAETFVREFPQRTAADRTGKVLMPQAAVSRDVLTKGLEQLGWEVTVVEAYRTLHPIVDPDARALVTGADILTFTSSSAVSGMLEIADRSSLPSIIATVGPVTSATVREFGLEVPIEAAVHTNKGLVDAIVAYVSSHPKIE